MQDANLAEDWEELRTAIADSQRELRQAQEAIEAVTVTVDSTDRMFRLTLDARGQVTAFEVQHDDYRDLEPYELGDRIVELLREGQRRVHEKVLGIVASRSPLAGAANAFLDPSTDAGSLLPEEMVTSLAESVDRTLGGGGRG